MVSASRDSEANLLFELAVQAIEPQGTDAEELYFNYFAFAVDKLKDLRKAKKLIRSQSKERQ